MKVGDALLGLRTVLLDTAPIIYYVENVAPYRRVMDDIVARVTRYVGVDPVVEEAAELRARLNLSLTDALQVAAAIAAGSDAFLTNNRDIVRVSGLRALVLGDLEPD